MHIRSYRFLTMPLLLALVACVAEAAGVGFVPSDLFLSVFVADPSTEKTLLAAAAPLSSVRIIPLPTPFDSLPTGNGNSDPLRYPLPQAPSIYAPTPSGNPFDIQPSGIQQQVEYDPSTGVYTITQTLNGVQVAPPSYMPFDEYWQQQESQMQSNYWETKSGGSSVVSGQGIVPPLYVGNELFDQLFGGSAIDIRPTGNIDLELGFTSNYNANPYNLRPRIISPLFNQDINIGVTGKIGDKLKLLTNYNTRALFDFDNQIKLEYTGNEDEIIQEIRAGYVNFPLPTSLIPGSQNLFGVQTKLKFGRLTLNAVVSQQKSRSRTLALQGGAQVQEFRIPADQYDEDRHFFLAQYFRNHFETAVANLPYINSQITITRLDVYVSDLRGTPEDVQRDIVAFADLAEFQPYNTNTQGYPDRELPQNASNSIDFALKSNPATRMIDQVGTILDNPAGSFKLKNVRDYVKIRTRKLDPDEYTYDPQLGFVSLNFSLRPNEVLGVAYEYTTIFGGRYQVGEFSEQVFTDNNQNDPRVLFLKMLKPTTQIPTHPMWDLMMKNVYSLGAYQVNQQDFKFDIYFENPGGGDLRYIPEGTGIKGIPMIRLLNLDRLNTNQEPYADGVFDFVESKPDFATGQSVQSNAVRFGTINAKSGRVYLPVLEPFGAYLKKKFDDGGNTDIITNKYIYSQLYDSTRTIAGDFPQFNRFYFKGSYKAAQSSEISLGAFNVPQGSVKVSSGGKVLQEGTDYTVDYNLGRVTILNEAYLNSGSPVNVSFEDNGAFGIIQRNYMGIRADYMVHKDLNFGATMVRLSERPFTQKVNFGEDPISNIMVGADMNMFQKAPFLTKTLDKLPFFDTKEESSVRITGEVAGFIPGLAKAVQYAQCGDNGAIYIDDFDGSTSPIDMFFQPDMWTFASTPKEANFPEAINSNDLSYGFNRAKLAWYRIDNSFYSNSAAYPAPIVTKEALSDWRVRPVNYNELFPQNQQNNLTFNNSNFQPINLAYYPEERGPYNFNTGEMKQDGTLHDPNKRWGGIMRNIESTLKNFEQQNVGFVEFWVLDPFDGTSDGQGGDMYLNIGNVSEDILKDSRQFYENAVPTDGQNANGVDQTEWGEVNSIRPLIDAFANEEGKRLQQDIGLDGLNNDKEQQKYDEYLTIVQQKLDATSDPVAQKRLQAMLDDPCGDDFALFRDAERYGDTDGILERYKNFTNPQGNSPLTQQATGYNTSESQRPDTEDLNQDKNLSDAESYFEYKIHLEPNMDENDFGRIPYFTNIRRATITLPNDQEAETKWLYFRIPIAEYSRKVGNANFRNVESMRLYLTNFEKPVVLRMQEFNVVRNIWRRYPQTILEPGEYLPDDNNSDELFSVSAVNIYENSSRIPVPYVIPPCIQAERITGASISTYNANEQSISVQVGQLKDGYGKGVYKKVGLDMRNFKKIKMFIHAEPLANNTTSCTPLEDGDVSAFIRIGDDFEFNYYEYEIPLKITEIIDGHTYTASEIWDTLQNQMTIDMQELVNLKMKRNFDPDARKDKPYYAYTDTLINGQSRKRRLSIVGSPDFGNVKQILLGVRNPKRVNATMNTDDGSDKCVEVWFNELRLTDPITTPGVAAIARADIKLADLGNLTFATNWHTAGFGTLEQKVSERFQDNYLELNGSMNLELGKLLPKKANIRLPLYANITQSTSTPKFDPYDTDVNMKKNIDTISLYHGADSARVAKKQRQTVATIKSVNLTNVRKERSPDNKRPPMPYDVENLNFTYAYTETELRDPFLESDKDKRHLATLGYAYNTKPWYIEPFKFIKSNSAYLKLIKDFNFNFIPSNISFRNEFDRHLGTLRIRSLTPGELPIDPYYEKSFKWTRTYGLKYNLTKSISLDFNATNTSVVDEPQNGATPRDTLWKGIKSFGRTRQYQQTANASYNLPLDKIPFLSWMQVRTRYGSSYFWRAANIALSDTLGNTIGNTQDIQINGELNFAKIYSSIPFIKDINTPPSNKKTPKVDKDKDKKNIAADTNKPKTPAPKGQINPVLRAFLRPLLSLRRISLTYNQKGNTTVPGYIRNSSYLGSDWNGATKPGADFVFGSQPQLKRWLEWAAADSVLTQNMFLTDQVLQGRNIQVDLKANFEPFRDLKIDLNMTLSHTRNHTEFYKIDDDLPQAYKHLSKIDVGSYSVTFLPIRTAFDKVDTNLISSTFKEFEQIRPLISQRFKDTYQGINPSEPLLGEYYDPINDTIRTDYAQGYGPYSQDVLIPAFLAAYTGKDPNKVSLNPFSTMPMPNWRVTYNGLSKLALFKNIFSNFSISHAYTSSLSINNYRNSLIFDDRYYDEAIQLVGDQAITDYIIQERIRLASQGDLDTLTNNFLPYFQIPQVLISEQFAPLFGIDIALKNGLTAKFDYKKTRTLGMSFQDYQLSETKGEEITIGAGYRIKELNLSLKLLGKQIELKNELAFNFDFSIRDNVTTNYRLDQGTSEPTNGSRVIRVAPTIDYVVSQKLRISLFFERTKTIPKTSLSFLTISSRGGLRLSLTL